MILLGNCRRSATSYGMALQSLASSALLPVLLQCCPGMWRLGVGSNLVWTSVPPPQNLSLPDGCNVCSQRGNGVLKPCSVAFGEERSAASASCKQPTLPF
eukprot:6480623-Amphidinium_carterae.1